MAGLCSVVCTILLLSLYSVDVQADISLPSFGNRTYISKGSDVTLTWTYKFPGKTIAATQWLFNNDVNPDEVLAHIVGSTVTIANSSLPNVNVIQPATLVLKNISLDYNGTYTLEVTVLGVTPTPSSDILVIVVVRPVANISCTTPVNITEGGNFSCICSGVGGNPPPTAYWYKDNNSTLITEGYLSALLDIKNASKEDNGTYICRAQSGTLTDEQRVDITVFVQPVANISCATPVNITEGENVSCICSAVGGNPPPTAYWLKDNNSISITKRYVNAPLDIKNIGKNDTGTYICRVQSGPLPDEKRVDITVFDKPVVNVACNTSVSIEEGKNFSCKCSGNDGSPPPSIMWLKDDDKLITVDNILTLRNISKNGTYVCRVQSGNLKKEKRVDVTVLVRPVANISCTTPMNITEGENVSCICSGVNGSPPATAYWFKDNNPKSIKVGYLSAPLAIRNISKNDNGTYICQARSGTLTDEQRVDITVFDKPVADVTCNTSVSIEEGKNFSCKCSGNDGSPPPSIMWLKDDDKLITVENILTLRNISKNGTYVCRVQSGNLKKEKRVHVTVLYEPRNIFFSSNQTNNTVTSGNTVKITCKADAFPEASYSISFGGSQLLTDAVDGSYTISSVNDSHAGNYTCVAKNIVGSVSAQFVLTVNDVDECLQASICPTGSSCVNTVGSYKCNCNEGLYKNETGQCVEGVSYRATFKLVDIKFTVDLENSSSPAYITLASNLISAISSAYQNNSFFFAVLVNGFSEGSVVANVTIIFNTSRSSPLAELKKVKNGKLGNYTVDLSSIKLIDARPTSTLIMPTRTVNPSASTSTAVPGRTPGDKKKKKTNTVLIAGAVAGGIVFLIILILIIWYCKHSGGGSRKRDMSGREEDIVGNHSNPSYVAAMGDSMDRGNAYESVDQAKIDEARASDEAGPSNESPPDAGNESPPDAGKESPQDAGKESSKDAGNGLPPVYAVVDKSKKTPKPPPEKQPDALTYASLDPVLLQPDSSKMRDRTREETNYASIDLEKLNEHQV